MPQTLPRQSRVFLDDSLNLISQIKVASSTYGESFMPTISTLADGNAMNPVFESDYAFTSNTGVGSVVDNGINHVGESVTLKATLFSQYTVTDLWQALTNGQLRIGLELQSIAGVYTASDTYVSYFNPQTPTAVPLPMAAWLFASGIGGLAFAKRRTRVK
jgi:hypothetical protein